MDSELTAATARVDRREILSLAIPAFLALVAEPLFLLADSAIVGHLGTVPLAGLSIAGSVLLSATGLFVFLAYATTAAVARQLGAGNTAGALHRGLDGLWLSVALGLVATAVVVWFADGLAAIFGATDAARSQAVTYLRIAAFGLPAMLTVLATTGTLRGLLDTRTPLVASVAGFSSNIVVSLLLVHGLHWGIAGSAWGTLITKNAMALGLVVVVLRRARRECVGLRPDPRAVLGAAHDGIPLVVRTIALRTILLLGVWAAAGLGDAALAAHQIVATIWSTLAFAVDALAIAAQAIVGRDLGAARIDAARAATTTMLRWGVVSAIILGLAVAAGRWVLLPAFTPDPLVQRYAAGALLVAGAGQLLAGYVFVADGVLMGAGDFRYLAWAMTLTAVAYLPTVLVARASGESLGPGLGLVAVWAAFQVMMAVRGLTLWWRLRGVAWAVTGAD